MQAERREYVTKLGTNTILTRDVIGDRGHLVLAAGTELTHSQVVRLKQKGIVEVWVKDKVVVVDDVCPLDPRIQKTYRLAVQCIQSLFVQAMDNQNLDLREMKKVLQEFTDACARESNFLNLIFNLRSHDEYTFQHCIGVGVLTRQLGEWWGVPKDELDDLFLGATLHDIGKCMIDEAILMKPGRLTPDEYEKVKMHTTFGYMILRNSGLAEKLAEPALEHHERIDGSGYPHGKTGDQIGLYGRLTAVADVFNAMTSRRVYKSAVSVYKVLDELLNNSFGQLDPQVVSVFVSRMTTYFVGNVVVLNDGTVGTVVLIPSNRPTRPLVRTEQGFVDLQVRQDLYIEEVRAI